MTISGAKALVATRLGLKVNWGLVIFECLTTFLTKRNDNKTLSSKVGYGLFLSAYLEKAGISLRNKLAVDYRKVAFLHTTSNRNIAIAAERNNNSTKKTSKRKAPEAPTRKAPKKASKKAKRIKRPSKRIIESDSESEEEQTQGEQDQHLHILEEPVLLESVLPELTEPEAVLPESSLPELPTTTTEEVIIDISVLDNQFARVQAWRTWRLSPLEDLIRQVDHYMTEEPYVLEWIGCLDIVKCLDLQFLEGILEEKKSALRGNSISEMVVPQQEATCINFEDAEFDEWLMRRGDTREYSQQKSYPTAMNELRQIWEQERKGKFVAFPDSPPSSPETFSTLQQSTTVLPKTPIPTSTEPDHQPDTTNLPTPPPTQQKPLTPFSTPPQSPFNQSSEPTPHQRTPSPQLSPPHQNTPTPPKSASPTPQHSPKTVSEPVPDPRKGRICGTFPYPFPNYEDALLCMKIREYKIFQSPSLSIDSGLVGMG
ncbi:unnamed protein product [Cuscuta epithymum]|uniref:Uncharacterized protein n=1 Tax=Cuscuta epithymum TaxID=186058 RepID=A0AAV0DVI1_9ASTE|nr:unnamed protein product [Cuscuta epithymum]